MMDKLINTSIEYRLNNAQYYIKNIFSKFKINIENANKNVFYFLIKFYYLLIGYSWNISW